MILNRTELFRGYSLNRFNKICNILSVNKIKYKYKVKNNAYSKNLFNEITLGNLGQRKISLMST